MKEEQRPLNWPEGWPRTRFQDRKGRPAWKKTYLQSVDILEKELKLLGATSWLITRNDASSEDAGVSLYLSLKPINDFVWQEALGFIGEVPTVQQIDRSYMEKAKRVHPDGPTPDIVAFHELTKHRDRARAWARGEKNVEHERVIACDGFKEQRWNVLAIRGTIHCMRWMEIYGATAMTERAWRGFSKQITSGVGDVVSVS
jgi:hypothetical protein